MEEEVPVQDPYWKKVILDTGRAVLTSAAKVLDFINAGREDFWKLLIVNLKPIFIFIFLLHAWNSRQKQPHFAQAD